MTKKRIFINYCRDDTLEYAHTLFDKLHANFPNQVFMDEECIEPGENWPKAIQAALRSCELCLVVIGQNWVRATTGALRFRDPLDDVRRELRAVVSRGAKIQPILVRAARIPDRTELPVDIRAVSSWQAIEILDGHWTQSFETIVKTVEAALRNGAKAKTALPEQDSEEPSGEEVRFYPLPKPTGAAPYHLPLASVVPASTMQSIRKSGKMVLHLVGNTGGVQALQAQALVAHHMCRQFEARPLKDCPAFFYHLGDIIFFRGEAKNYYSQFYHPYANYPAAIVAIPGNHDGCPREGDESLAGFMANFCAPEPRLTPQARRIPRYAMTQPNPYWTLETPLATFVGIYTNVPNDGMLDQRQQAWLVSEFKNAPTSLPLILTMHHPIYSLDARSRARRARRGHCYSTYLEHVLEETVQRSGRSPQAVFASHVMNYQRFTRKLAGLDIPYIIAGAGGYRRLHVMARRRRGDLLKTPFRLPKSNLTLEAYCDSRHGFMRLAISRRYLKGEYFAIPGLDDSGDAPAQLLDSFTLDLAQNRMVSRPAARAR